MAESFKNGMNKLNMKYPSDSFGPFLLALFFLSITFIFMGCWGKQDHELLLPELPHYQLTGTVVDEVTQLPLPNIQLVVNMAQSLYAVEWQTLTLYTDSSGFFQIDTVYPGSYTLDFYRAGYRVLAQNIFQAHEDRDLLYTVPEPLESAGVVNLGQENPGSGNPKFAWQGSILWIMGVYKGYINNQYYSLGVAALMHTRISGNMIITDHAFHNPAASALGIVSTYNKIYAYYRDRAELITPSTGLITSTVSWEGLISGLTVREGQFYTSWSNKIESRGSDLTSVNSILETNAENLALLTNDGHRFWALDQNRDWVVSFDSLGTIVGAYKLFHAGKPYPLNVKNMAFDSLHHLWVSTTDKNLYWFE